MKKIAFCSAALLISINMFAQFGIIGGYTSSSTSIKEAINVIQDKKFNNFHAGITYKCDLFLGFAIQPSLLYNVKGFDKNIEGLGDIDFRTGYLELPVQLQWGPQHLVNRPYLFAEPFIGYAIHNSTNLKSVLSDIRQDMMNKFEYGIGLGVGLELFRHLQISARYYWNFGAICEFSNIGTEMKKIQIKDCNGLQISAAVLF